MEKYILLIYKELKESINSEEKILLEQWLGASVENVKVKKDITSAYESMDAPNTTFPIDKDADYQILIKKMNLDQTNNTKSITPRKWMRSTGTLVASMAASFILLAAALFLFNHFSSTQEQEWISYKNNGLNKSTVELSDGSKVWLNKNSQIHYKKTFEDNSRIVKLEGEGFFEVLSNKRKPFRVLTAQSEVTVLGTAFNVNATDKENTIVSVQNGKVLFTNKGKTQQSILTADMSGHLNHTTNDLKVQDKNSNNDFLWHTDRMSFKSATLPEVFSTLESYFKIQIINKNKSLNACEFSMTPQKPDLDRVLENLKKIYQVSITKKDGVYQLSGGHCN